MLHVISESRTNNMHSNCESGRSLASSVPLVASCFLPFKCPDINSVIGETATANAVLTWNTPANKIGMCY